MKVAENIKIKDFIIVSRRGNNQLKGAENNFVHEISYKGTYVHTEYGTKANAEKWIRDKVKKVNAILQRAREELPL